LPDWTGHRADRSISVRETIEWPGARLVAYCFAKMRKKAGSVADGLSPEMQQPWFVAVQPHIFCRIDFGLAGRRFIMIECAEGPQGSDFFRPRTGPGLTPLRETFQIRSSVRFPAKRSVALKTQSWVGPTSI
jgi:hypothetical protein